MKRITFPFVESNCKIPIIRFACGDNHELYALVDTGSESTLLEREVMEDYPKFKSKTRLTGIQSMVGVAGETKVEVTSALVHVGIETEESDGVYLEFEGTICNLGKLQESFKQRFGRPIALLVGSDFMTRLDAKINMKNRSISLLVKSDSKGISWAKMPA